MNSSALQTDWPVNILQRNPYSLARTNGYIPVATFQELRRALEPFAWLAQSEEGCLRRVLVVFGAKRQVMAEAFAAARDAYASSADDDDGHGQLVDALLPFAEASSQAVRAACALFRLPAADWAQGGESRESYESLSMAADFRLARALVLAARRELRP